MACRSASGPHALGPAVQDVTGEFGDPGPVAVHRSGQGTDAGIRIVGRKRHLGCDTLGLLLTVMVTTASISNTGTASPCCPASPHD